MRGGDGRCQHFVPDSSQRGKPLREERGQADRDALSVARRNTALDDNGRSIVS